jgi:nitrogen regulatory protein PII
MKLITAIIRPDKLDELIQVVIENGGHGLTATEVRGFGRQFGEPAVRTVNADLGGLGLPANRTAALLPKVRLDILVLDEDADTMVEAIAKHARTKTIGDGKIWVSTVDSAMRVRTGARDRNAVLGAPEDWLALLGEGIQALKVVAAVVCFLAQALDAFVQLRRDGLVVRQDAKLSPAGCLSCPLSSPVARPA